jgi:hypothetical protein
VNWMIRVGKQSAIGASSAADIVVGRLEYLAEHGTRCNAQRLLSEAIEYARLIRGWIREHEPRVVLPLSGTHSEHIGVRHGGKPGPMSDG